MPSSTSDAPSQCPDPTLVCLDDVGSPMAVCSLDYALLAVTPGARTLLSAVGVDCDSLPRSLPAALSQALARAPFGQSTEWQPVGVDERCIGLTRYRLGDQRQLLLMREITDAQKELRRRLQQQRLEAIGRLVSGIAHDLRAPLSSIMFGASVLAQRCGAMTTEQLREKLEQITAAASRQHATIAGLLDFARLGPPVKTDIRIEVTFTRVAALLRPTLREGRHRISVHVARGAEQVHGNPLTLEQILVNLVLNAIESASRPVTVSLRSTAASSQGMVEIHVVDDGEGIPEDLRGRIFEPFFTTKQNGTGLGLVTAREAAVDQGGDLRLQPSAGGAHFVLRVPSAATATTRQIRLAEGME